MFRNLTKNKQLLDEANHDIKNYTDRGQCCLPKRMFYYTFKDIRNVKNDYTKFAILFILFWRPFRLEMLAAPGPSHDRVINCFFLYKFDPKNLLLGADHIGG